LFNTTSFQFLLIILGMKTCKARALLLVSLGLFIGGGGCGGGSDSGGSEQVQQGEVSRAATLQKRLRENFVNVMVVPTFSELSVKARALQTQVQALEASPSEARLKEAQAAWIQARIPWEKSEAALFGPADIFGIDPAIDSWPLSEGELVGVLNSKERFTSNEVSSLQDSLKGFHAIEWILFGPMGSQKVENLGARELSYATALSQNLAEVTDSLLKGWTEGINGEKAYAVEFLNAGEGSVTFPTEQLAAEQVIRGLTTIITEVADSKIEEPFRARDPGLTESQFSENATEDFSNNIRGVKDVVTTTLSELLGGQEGALYQKVIRQIDESIAAIQSVPKPFSRAVTERANDRAIQNAQGLLRALRTTFEVEVLPLAGVNR
jgi:putative iron-regulated protein